MLLVRLPPGMKPGEKFTVMHKLDSAPGSEAAAQPAPPSAPAPPAAAQEPAGNSILDSLAAAAAAPAAAAPPAAPMSYMGGAPPGL